MDLNRLAIRARLRSPWASIDLGVLLARSHWRVMFALWLLPAALVYGTALLLFYDSPNASLLLVWWFKPLYDRLPLLVASRGLFSETPTLAAALRQWRTANRNDWLAWLSWRRLSVTRAFDLPVTLLENSQGAVRSARLAILHRQHSGAALWLTMVCIHVEILLMTGLMALIYMMVPEQLEVDWMPLFTQDVNLLTWLYNGLLVLVMAAVAPFYICSGFMLYIGRRVELEAWDIEIQFRNLLQRLTATARKSSHQAEQQATRQHSVTTLLLLVVLGFSGFGGPGAASAVAAEVLNPQQARVLIDQTLAEEDFHQQEMIKGWRLKEKNANQSAFPEWLIALVEWLENRPVNSEPDRNLEPLLASLLELLLWLGTALLIGYLLWRYRALIRSGLGRGSRAVKTGPAEPPQTLFGLDVRRTSLPEDVCSEVLALWQQGKQRASLGLLYRATLAHLIEQFGFHFGDHLTEQECAQLVRQRAALDSTEAPQPELSLSPGLVQLVAQLTAVWQQQAYAHRAPQTARLESLCVQWREVFADEH